jgi:hypothetical protein
MAGKQRARPIIDFRLVLMCALQILEDIIVRKFEGLPGDERVARGQYVLEDAQTNQALDRRKNWKACFRPGRRVLMSMTFQDFSLAAQVCPSCGAEGAGAADSLITW